MKTLLITILSLGLAVGASAQRGGHYIAHGGGGYYHAPAYRYNYYPRTYVGVGFGYGFGYGLGFSPWGWGPWGWGPYYGYGYPPYYYGRGPMPPQLEGQIQGIKDDYSQQIKDVRHDKALSHKEKRSKIDQLKLDRDHAVIQARHDFYNNSRRNYNQNNTPPKGNSNGSSSGSGDGPEYQDQGSGTGK